MSNKMKNVEVLTHNPLGIIGLFLVLVESIAALVLSNSNLEVCENRMLVIFIILFPILVIYVFYNLVTEHHHKLYSPKDYKDEKNFKETFSYNFETRKHNKTKDESILTSQTNKNDSRTLDVEELQVIKDIVVEIDKSQKELFGIVHKQKHGVSTKNEIGSQIESLEKFISEKNRYSTKVIVNELFQSDGFINKINSLGYDSEVYESFTDTVDKISRHEAIWVGQNIQFEYVAEIIEIAIDYFPHLKYIEISNDEEVVPSEVHEQIFIGGASLTAEERKLRKYSKREILAIKEMKSKHEMHEYFRR